MKYYLWINDAQEGPYEDWEIHQKLIDQKINWDTLAYLENGSNTNWVKVSEIPAISFTGTKIPAPQEPSSARWYYVSDQQGVAGPVRPEGLKVLAEINQISKETLICSEGTETWIPYGQAFPQNQIPTITISKNRKQNTESPFLAGFFVLIICIAALIFINSANSTSGRTVTKKSKSNATVAEGEALLEEIEKYNANPRRTQAERKDIERRMQDYQNRVYSK